MIYCLEPKRYFKWSARKYHIYDLISKHKPWSLKYQFEYLQVNPSLYMINLVRWIIAYLHCLVTLSRYTDRLIHYDIRHLSILLLY